MAEIYHDKVLETFCDNFSMFSDILEFDPIRFKRNIKIKWEGEIDIALFGRSEERALVEVKSHSGLVHKFTNKQYPVYRIYDPEASIFLLLGTKDMSLNPKDFFLKKYWPLD